MLETEVNEVYEFPVSPAQSAFWMLNQMAPDNPAYNIPVVVRILGGLDVAAMQSAVQYIVQRHEILRTQYVISDGKLVQRVSASADFTCHYQSFSASPDGAAKAIHDLVTKNIRSSFDLGTSEIVRAGLLEESKNCFVFYLVVHHVAVDHAAVGQLMKELQCSYDAYCQGLEPNLDEPELQYVDYVMWSREHHQETSEKIELWRNKLAPFSGQLMLPTNGLKPTISSGEGAELRFSFTKLISDKVKVYSHKNKISIFQTLFSAYTILLSRLSGQEDIVVGTPFTLRGGLPELELVIGSFINTLPIPVMVHKDKSFIELGCVVKDTLIFAFENQDISFESIVNACVKKRSTATNPLFQVSFVFQEPPQDLRLSSLKCESLNYHNGGAMYELHVWMWENNGQLSGSICYDTDIHNEAAISRFAANFETLLDSLMENSHLPLASIDLLSGDECDLLIRWNETSVPTPAAQSLPELFANSCARTPEAIAVVNGDSKLSYVELEQRANQVANYLISQGIKAGDYVAISLTRSVNLLVGLLGVIKTGATYVPLDPDYPNDRLLYMLEQSHASLLVSESGLTHSLPDYSCQRINIDIDWPAIAACESMQMNYPPATSLMYVIFTSGSTGLPKGVQISHGAVTNFLTAMALRPGIHSSDKLLAVTTLSFDISVLELFLPLTVGATVVLASKDDTSDGHRLKRLLHEYQVTVMQATPSTWRMLLASGWEGGGDFKALCGGEAFPRDLASALLARAGAVWNMYGPTETTVWSTCYKIDADIDSIPIGQPIGNTQCYVLNDALKLQPIGVPGELYIGGDGVATGYLGQADLTAQRFIDDMFRPSVVGAKLYRTGDLVRWREDGNLEYLNRVDTQVKIRGFRIELEEIEQILLKLEQVERCVVTVEELSDMDKRLVGYVQFVKDLHLTTSEIRRYLRAHLPEYMVVQHVVDISSMPLTPNGKVDRKALPSPFAQVSEVNEFIAPTSDAEKVLAQIWENAIGIARVSADANFFELGGHSMLALQVRSKIEESFGVQITTQDLMLDSLAQLAAKLFVAVSSAEKEKPVNHGGFFGKLFNKKMGK
ncbi:amino acid adenylation domain-containing protein [Simiduia curdlanivorans]|uniref:Amino acid adenylation domain-containing protein n=1 Tax=Simiduia curdlanivorans TaxID=1492769 RepID=A0ABV8VBD4_9GAMM|nr:amino acid adenylation domain-containing protein [Simiduia curdlanivorans]MDN3638516.1 amino acid adenylation domain-containing protein [Simiduia curdlanivorans]